MYMRTPALYVCIFARFEVNCEVTPLGSFEKFKLIITDHRMELRWAPTVRSRRSWPIWPIRNPSLPEPHLDFVRNILLCKFHARCYILLSGTRPKRRYTHTYLRRGYASLGTTGRLVPKPRCCYTT